MKTRKQLREEIAVLEGKLALAHRNMKMDSEVIDVLLEQEDTRNLLREALHAQGEALRRSRETVVALTAELEEKFPATDLTNAQEE